MNLDLSNPDGKGTFTITAIGQKEDTMTVYMEGKVEGYGFVTLTHEYSHMARGDSGERLGGTVTGTAEAIDIDSNTDLIIASYAIDKSSGTRTLGIGGHSGVKLGAGTINGYDTGKNF